jgi:hypothetical protein
MTNPHLLPLPEGQEVDRAVPCSVLILAAKPLCGLTSPAERPIHLSLSILAALIVLFGCETTNYVPPVTAKMVSANSQRQEVDLRKLREGRTLFVHRCIECHTLPALWHYTPKDWAGIVNDMSHRASLKPAERDAVIAYILAVRATER